MNEQDFNLALTMLGLKEMEIVKLRQALDAAHKEIQRLSPVQDVEPN